jgi:hypothetical protein
MNFKCPHCNKESNFMDSTISKDLEYVIAALPSFGTRYGHLVMGYAQIFGVTPMHLKAKKLRLIIEEMKKLFDAESFGFEKRAYKISHAGIGEALDICIKHNFTKPLTNHNYLKSIMIGISEREGSEKSRTAEKALRQSEDISRSGGGHPVDCRAGSPNTPRLTPEEIKANQQRARDIANSLLGKTIGGKNNG